MIQAMRRSAPELIMIQSFWPLGRRTPGLDLVAHEAHGLPRSSQQRACRLKEQVIMMPRVDALHSVPGDCSIRQPRRENRIAQAGR
jgi:hypothetical protein